MTAATTDATHAPGVGSVVPAPCTATARPTTTWWAMSRDTSQTRQHLDAAHELPEPEPIGRELFVAVLAAVRRGPITELRGLRLTWGMRDALLAVAHFSGADGDRAFASNRRVAAHSGRCVRTVQHARQMARTCGLLIRETHGAGRYIPGARKKSGALDLLAFPGGVEGAKKLLARLRDAENLVIGATGPRARRSPAELTDEARRVLADNRGLAARIARELGQPHDDEGAVRVVAHVLARAPRRKIRIPGAYILKAVSRDHQLRSLWPVRHANAANRAGGDALFGFLSGAFKPPD